MNNFTHRNERYKKVNFAFLILYIATSIYGIWSAVMEPNYLTAFLAFSGIILLAVPPIFYKVFKLKPTEDVNFLFYIFCYFSVTIGNGLYGIQRIPYFDKVLHFSSGVLIAFFGFILFRFLKHNRIIEPEKDYPLLITFVNSFNLAIAVIWELYEYAIYVVAGVDALNFTTTGPHDTMGDILVCAMGGVIVSIWLYSYYKKNKPGYFMRIYEHFCFLNNK